MSLRLQINLIIAVLMALFIGAMVYQRIDDTRRSVREEIEGSNRVATQLLTRLSQTPERAGLHGMASFLEQLGRVRANDVGLYDASGQLIYVSPPSTYKAGRYAPDFFTRLMLPEVAPQEIHVAGGKLVITADASRAILDGWDDLLTLLSIGAIAFAIINPAVFWFTGRALNPLWQVVEGLKRMEQGRYETRLPLARGKEARLMSLAFNRMAQAVEENAAARKSASEARQRLQENRELTQMIQSHIEEERRTIARELHDELGQSITAIKSLGLSIARRAHARDGQIAQAAKLIADTAGRMYEAVHQMIPRLRPLALDHFGLQDALGDLAAEWHLRHPEVELVLNAVDLPSDLGDTLSTTAYRIVQESVNNALRHSGGQRIAVNVAADGSDLVVSVEDDGVGLPPDWQRPGHYGVRGMRERAAALDGSFELEITETGGVRVLARLPLR